MKFQPGQSGNPAGRPLGARNKKTIAREEELAKRAEAAVERIIFLAGGGHAAAMRICAEWLRPGGNSRALALELPEVRCADDAQSAFDMVIAEFGNGAITVRELPTMLGSVDRMARVAQRIDAMREREHERYSKQRVHGVHPDMIPKVPPGWTDPQETLKAAIERGENPFPDDPEKLAYILAGEELFPSVNSGGTSLPREAAEGGSPSRNDGEPGGGTTSEGLYSPVNLDDEPPLHSESDSQRDAAAARDSEAVSEPPAPSLPRAAGERGERSEPGGGLPSDANTPEQDGLYSPVNFTPDGEAPQPSAADAAPPFSADGGGTKGDGAVASENRSLLPDGSRLATVLGTAAAMGKALYLKPG